MRLSFGLQRAAIRGLLHNRDAPSPKGGGVFVSFWESFVPELQARSTAPAVVISGYPALVI
jgi:hypothetical protein